MLVKPGKLCLHQQDKDSFCGEAVAQMMIASITEEVLPQDTFGSQNLDPDELCSVLNAELKKRNVALTFAIANDDCWKTAIQRIAEVYSQTGLGVPTQVRDSRHWVIVSGVMLGNDQQLYGVFMDDPYSRAVRNVPHFTGDLCGTGQTNGSSDVYVTLSAWRDYEWRNPNLSVQPPGYFTIVPQEFRDRQRMVFQLAVSGAGEAIQDGRAACKLVDRELLNLGLKTSGLLADRLKDVVTEPVGGHPYLTEDEPYFEFDEAFETPYLVNLDPGNGKPGGIASVDPEAGRLLAVLFPTSVTPMPRADLNEAVDTVDLFADRIGTLSITGRSDTPT